MENRELRKKVIQFLNQKQKDNEKLVSSVDMYRLIVDEYPNVSFSTIDMLLTEIAKLHSLPNKRIYTKFVTSENEYNQYTIVFLNEQLRV